MHFVLKQSTWYNVFQTVEYDMLHNLFDVSLQYNFLLVYINACLRRSYKFSTCYTLYGGYYDTKYTV